MSSEIIKKHLEELKAENKKDSDFVALLQQSNEKNEAGDITAEKIVALINKRYVESKKDTA